jgi:hypothetical protein
MGWFATTRAILELLYFASGLVIAVAAVWALSQIRLTKQIAKGNARRESVKLAADLCRYFAESVVAVWAKANDDYTKSGLKCLSVSPPQGQPPFVIQDGEIVGHHFNLKQLAEDSPKFNSAINYLNALEAFAIPFAAGVADEDIGYRETARPFCQGVTVYMPVIFHLRATNAGRFESIVRLYATWSKRLAAEMTAPVMKVMQQLAQEAGKDRIKPLDF